ncbi:uncharacterized protein [Misgurnus anguillicaudatus]|uniref:uncharacterized protein n=1 Tax=Misgurnus anguillicaudatus TaxID=75329 RepID=UPI003CCFD3EF
MHIIRVHSCVISAQYLHLILYNRIRQTSELISTQLFLIASLCRVLKMFLMCVYLCMCFCGLTVISADPDEVKSVSVMEGDSVTLHTDIKLQTNDLTVWRFGLQNSLIASINGVSKDISIYDDVLDGRFRDRLQVNNQTGDLTITNITTQHTGLYQIAISGKQKISYRVNVTVYGSSIYIPVLISFTVGCLMIVASVLIFRIYRKYKNTKQQVNTVEDEITYTDLAFNKTQACEETASVMDDVVYAGVVSHDDD